MTSIATQLQAFSALTTKQIQRAAARSLNRAATSLRAEAARKIRETINISAADAKDAISLKNASALETLSTMKATAVVVGKPIPLMNFVQRIDRVDTKYGPRQAVYVKIIKGRRAMLVQNAFVATVGNGHEGVFKRIGGERLPIKELFTTSITDVLKDADVVAYLLSYGRDRFSDNFESELRYQLSLQT